MSLFRLRIVRLSECASSCPCRAQATADEQRRPLESVHAIGHVGHPAPPRGCSEAARPPPLALLSLFQRVVGLGACRQTLVSSGVRDSMLSLFCCPASGRQLGEGMIAHGAGGASCGRVGDGAPSWRVGDSAPCGRVEDDASFRAPSGMLRTVVRGQLLSDPLRPHAKGSATTC